MQKKKGWNPLFSLNTKYYDGMHIVSHTVQYI